MKISFSNKKADKDNFYKTLASVIIKDIEKESEEQKEVNNDEKNSCIVKS